MITRTYRIYRHLRRVSGHQGSRRLALRAAYRLASLGYILKDFRA